MGQQVLHKRSNVEGKLPSGSTLDYGEIAINYNANEPFLSIKVSGATDGNEYVKFSSDDVIFKEIIDNEKTTAAALTSLNESKQDKIDDIVTIRNNATVAFTIATEVSGKVDAIEEEISNNEKVIAAGLNKLEQDKQDKITDLETIRTNASNALSVANAVSGKVDAIEEELEDIDDIRSNAANAISGIGNKQDKITDLETIRTNASNALSVANAVSGNMTIKKGNGNNSALQTPKGGTFTDKNKYTSTTLQEVPADASGDYSVALNGTAAATAAQAVAQGHRCIARGETSHAEGHCAVVDYFDEVQNGYGSHAEGYGTYVIGTYSHAEGSETAIAGNNSHAEGGSTMIEGDFAHAEGYGSFVGDRNNAPSFDVPEGGEGGNVTPGPDVAGKKGVAAHAEGNYTIAEGNYSHAEGRQAKTFGEASHAEGNETITEGNYSHAEGWMSTANGAYSHAEGQYTRTHADAAHSEGNNTDAYAPFSHAEGIGTRTSTDIIGQHVEGYYNAESDGVLVVGCGTSDEDRKNALDVKQDGRVFVKGVGNYDGTSDEAIDLAGAINNIYDKSETYNKIEIDNRLSRDYYSKSQTDHQISTEINKLATVAQTGSYNDLKNKPTIPSAVTESTVSGWGFTKNKGTVTDVKVNGTSLEQTNGAVNITAASLGLSRVLKYCGITTTELNDGDTTNPVVIDSKNHTAEAGCVVFYEDTENGKTTTKEFVFNGTKWELLGSDLTYKVVQEAVSSPDAEGNATAFIDSISQDANGVITVTKKNVKKDDLIVNVTYSQLQILRSTPSLIPGQQYRITDYVTRTKQANTIAKTNYFDVIVTADSVDTLNENARVCKSNRDLNGYFEFSDLESWEIKYCLDNDTTRFAWADNTNQGRGVIYYMKDEFGNECPYDFKNIQFARWGLGNPVGYAKNASNEWVEDDSVTDTYGPLKVGFYGINDNNFTFESNTFKVEYTISSTPTYCYTFGKGSDYSLTGSNYSNVIKEYKTGNKIHLNNIVFLDNSCYYNTFGNNCYESTFGISCNTNTFGNHCHNNTFGDYCNSNTFGISCNYNRFGDGCYQNTLGNDCSSNTLGNNGFSHTLGNMCNTNTFGNDCNTNTFGDGCYQNTFGNNCCTNTFGNGCYYNTFGNDCRTNTFGNGCGENTFGNYCCTNTFGNGCGANTFGLSESEPASYYTNIIFDSGNRRINLNCTSEASLTKPFTNVRICLGVNNKTINCELCDYETKVALNSKGELKIYCEADLIA